ncbi:UDP-N-acetylmuramate--L-alanine ligase [Candidatus Woesebacteria bacterium]|nr:MAG: UDP-N-acetylmuramate--L-alanine ligase [Candidatus Woesebacteria bacterium]
MIKNKIHFMGIGGSGMSAAAIIAKKQGFEVDGCDELADSPYLLKVKKMGIPVSFGHDPRHIVNANVLAVSPSVLFSNKKHPEVLAGRKKTLLTWQQFTGRYLLKNKRVMCISGTHGKSTVTTLVGFLYEKAKLDPSVIVGANFTPWGANFHYGKSNIFILEADEFYGNFLNYKPDTLIINNIEYDHPDYFRDEDHVINTFRKLLNKLEGNKLLILNQDSKGINKLVKTLSKEKKDNLNIMGYTISEKPLVKLANSFTAKIVSMNSKGVKFSVKNEKTKYSHTFNLNMYGIHNVSNALGLICLAKHDNIPDALIEKTLRTFPGTQRRLQLIGETKSIKIYDDYAHHPTAVKATLSAIKQKHPKERILCVFEPHTFSRTARLLVSYKDAFSDADIVVVAPIYKSRDTKTFGVSNKSIVKVCNHNNAVAIDSFDEIKNYIIGKARKGDVVIVMGAGKSYQLAKEVLRGK